MIKVNTYELQSLKIKYKFFKIKEMKYKCRYITFIEVMIILSIILLSLGLIGANIQKWIKQQRFKTEVVLIVDQLRLAQDIMLILNADALVKFSKNEAGFKIKIDLENILAKQWKREIDRKHPLLTTIKSIEFADNSSDIKKQIPPFNLNFLSGGAIMSQGMIRLAAVDKDLEAFIFLPGYPYPIESVQKGEQSLTDKFQNLSDVFEKLTFNIRRDIEEKKTLQ
jgi:type II secretory pathway pseudopilin PulG